MQSCQSCSIFDRGRPKRDGKTRTSTSTIEGGFDLTLTLALTLLLSGPGKELGIFLFEFVKEQLSDCVEGREDVHAGGGDGFEALHTPLPVVQQVFKIIDWSHTRNVALIELQIRTGPVRGAGFAFAGFVQDCESSQHSPPFFPTGNRRRKPHRQRFVRQVGGSSCK